MNNLVHHYTSQAGLLGIIQNREIWATNLLFLNDSMEFNYAIDRFREYVEKINKKQELPQGEIKFLEEFCKELREFSTPRNQGFDGIYICSFSEHEDLLSQWRGYCPDGSGYSLGFDFTDLLQVHAANQGFRLVKCIYEEDKQNELIEDFTLKTLDRFRKSEGNSLSNNKMKLKYEMVNKLWNDFLFIAPSLKHPKFIEEGEWRLVSSPKSLDDVEFRQGRSMLMPFIKIKLTGKEKKQVNLDCIHRICFGPTLYPDLTKISLENFLKKEKNYRYSFDFGDSVEVPCEVIKSDIPYRVN